jgi:hypothetical protein
VWPVSKKFLEALRYGHVISSSMDVYLTDNHNVPYLAYRDAPLISGSVTCSRKSNTRRTLTAEVIIPLEEAGPTSIINSTNCRVQVWQGIEFAGGVERVPIGVFRVNSSSQTDEGAFSITGASLEIAVIEDRFLQPYQPAYGRLATQEIAGLIQQSTNGATVINRTTSDYKVRKTSPWERERWDAIQDLAEAIVADVYCGPDGNFYITDTPSLMYSPVVWVVDEGPRGVLIGISNDEDRSGAYNAVVAAGSSSDSSVPAVSAVAYDLDPMSPTYWNGGFGHVPKFYTSQFLYTVAQCQAVADGQLITSRGQNKTMKFTAVPNPALEPGDVVMVSRLDGSYERHILEGFTIPLGEGDWTADTTAAEPQDTDSGDDTSGLGDAMSLNAMSLSDAKRMPSFT